MTQPRLGVTFTPLVPKRPVVDLKVPNRVNAVMRQGGGDLVALRKTYPPAIPWKNPPKSGIRKGGKRLGGAGGLSSGWQVKFGRGSFDVWNPIRYAGYVQGFRTARKGKRQTAVMRVRNWKTFDQDIATLKRTLTPGLRRAFKQSRR